MAWGGTEGSLGLERGSHEYSEETAHTIDVEVEHILAEQHDRATAILSEHREALEAVAAALIEHETLDGAAVARLVEAGAPAR